MNKNKKKLPADLERAILDIKKKYGNKLDIDFLKKKIEQIIDNTN